MIYLFYLAALANIAYAVLIGYYHRAWKQMPVTREPDATDALSTRVTVLIPARNEAHQIRACLDSYIQQRYPALLRECIVIDDHSTDQTAAIVEEYQQHGVRCLRLASWLQEPAINSYKKKAIELGIRNATGDLILTTDADCVLPPLLIASHVHARETGSSIVQTGPVKISYNGSWLSRFQELDFISLQGITGASVSRQLHSMGNGANLSYTKAAFHAVNGFAQIDQLASGDDMLLMQKIAAEFPGTASYLKTPAAVVTTAPAGSISEFLQQRIRWASKASAYQEPAVKWVLALVYVYNLILLVAMVSLFFNWGFWWIVLLLLTGKLFAELPFMHTVAGFFSARKSLWYFPLFQPVHILYTVVAGSFGQFGTYRWKGRRVR